MVVPTILTCAGFQQLRISLAPAFEICVLWRMQILIMHVLRGRVHGIPKLIREQRSENVANEHSAVVQICRAIIICATVRRSKYPASRLAGVWVCAFNNVHINEFSPGIRSHPIRRIPHVNGMAWVRAHPPHPWNGVGVTRARARAINHYMTHMQRNLAVMCERACVRACVRA